MKGGARNLSLCSDCLDSGLNPEWQKKPRLLAYVGEVVPPNGKETQPGVAMLHFHDTLTKKHLSGICFGVL